MDSNDKKQQDIKKKILFKTIGENINAKRTKTQKGINKFSFEYDIGNGLLSRLEKGKTDTKISTLWKLANSFDIPLSEIIKEIENKLPQDFNFYE